MAELVVVQAASELSLLEMGGNVLVGHLLKSSLEQIDFLYRDENVSTCACPLTWSWRSPPDPQKQNITYLILAPSPASTGRRVLAVVLCDTVLVAFHNVRCRRIHGRVHGHCHGRRHDFAGGGVQRIEVVVS